MVFIAMVLGLLRGNSFTTTENLRGCMYNGTQTPNSKKDRSFKARIYEVFRGDRDKELKANIQHQKRISEVYRCIEEEVNVVTNQFREHIKRRIYEILQERL